MSDDAARLPAVVQWTAAGRAVVFALSAMSIWCLLAEMYDLLSMRTFFCAILLPATAALYGLGLLVSPYAAFFGIDMSTRFVIVTLIAHSVFGAGLGRSFAWWARRWRLPAAAPA